MVYEILVCPWFPLNSITTQLQPTLVFKGSFGNYKLISTLVFAPVIPFVCIDLPVAMHVSFHFHYISLALGVPF